MQVVGEALSSQALSHMSHCRSSKRSPQRLLMISGIFGVICLAAGPALGAEPGHKYDGVYTGKRSLTKGAASPTCPVEDDVSVTIHGETLTFTNNVLTKFTIYFDPRQDGSFDQITDQGGIAARIKGRITGDVIEADVNNRPCEHHWSLKKGS